MPSEIADTKYERIYQACDSCRSKKLKCDLGSVDQPRAPPCARCHRQSKDCTFTTTRNRITAAPRANVDDYVARNKRRRTDGEETTRPGSRPESRMDGFVPRHSTSGSRRTTESETFDNSAGIRVNEDVGVSETEFLKKAAYTTHDALDLLYRAGCHSQYAQRPPSAPSEPPPAPTEQPPAPGQFIHQSRVWTTPPETIDPSRQSARSAWSKVKFIQDGLFTADEAIAYIDYFYAHIDPFTPVTYSTYKDHSRHLTLTQEEPVLAVTMLMLASRFLQLPGPCAMSRRYMVHERLWTFLQRMITRIFWGQDRFPGTNSTGPSLRTLGTCEALMLLSDWHPRSLHFADEEDSISILPREASGMWDGAKELTGSSPIFWLEWSWRSDRMTWSLLGTAVTLATELGVFDEHANTRFGDRDGQGANRKATSFHDRALRLQQLLWVYSSHTTGKLGYKDVMPSSLLEKAGPRGDATTLWVGITSVIRKVNELLFPSRKHPMEIISNGSYLGLLFILKPTLEEWRRDFDRAELSKEMRAILTIEYGYSMIYMNSVALQAVIHHRDSKATKPLHAGNDEFLLDVVHGGRKILQTVVDDLLPGDLLKHIPVRTYSRILAGALFLLKTAGLNCSQQEAMISFDLVDGAAKALQESVVDDVNLSSRWGKLLANLCYEQRLRVARKHPMADTQVQPQADGSLSHEMSLHAAPTSHPGQTMDVTAAGPPSHDQSKDRDVIGIWDESSLPDLLGLGQHDDCFILPDWLGFPLDPLRNVNEASSFPTAWTSSEGIFDMLGPS